MFCPNWIFDICASRTAKEFLEGEISLEGVAKKYSTYISEHYHEIQPATVQQTVEGILVFLSEIDANEMAVELLNDFCHFRLYFEKMGSPRKMKPLFGSLEDPAKTNEVAGEGVIKAFRAYVFALRSNAGLKAPVGWLLEEDQHIPKLAEVAGRKVSILDAL